MPQPVQLFDPASPVRRLAAHIVAILLKKRTTVTLFQVRSPPQVPKLALVALSNNGTVISASF